LDTVVGDSKFCRTTYACGSHG